MLGVGVLGAGYFGAIHAEALGQLADARLVAVASGRRGPAEALAAEHGARAHEDWRSLVEDPAVEAVIVATPHHLHVDITVAALRLGKSVLLEKPMAANLAECDTILAAAERSSGQLMIGHVPRYMAPITAAGKVVQSGRVGRPVTGTSTMVKLWMQDNRRAWHLDPATGGGMLMTAGIHAIDQLLWVMGGTVASVSAMAGWGR